MEVWEQHRRNTLMLAIQNNIWIPPKLCVFRLSTSAWVYFASLLLFYPHKDTRTQSNTNKMRRPTACTQTRCRVQVQLLSHLDSTATATGLVGASWLGSINHNYFQKHDHHRFPAVKGLSSCSSFELMGAMSVSISYRCLLKHDNDELKSRGDIRSEPPFPRYVPS